MKKQHKTILLFLLSIFFSTQLFSQDKLKDELFVLHQDMVKIDMVDKYEKLGKELFDLFRKHGMEATVKFASKTDDNTYNFLSPLKNYADLDNRSSYWENLSKKAGEKSLSNIFEEMDKTYHSHRDVLVRLSHDLSFWPENNRLKGEDVKFLHFDHYYFKDGMMDEGVKLMKEFKEILIAKNSDDGYSVWIFDIGEEYGHIVITRLAKNGADYFEQSDKRMKTMREEMKEMWPKFSATLKKFHHQNGSRIPEFIYTPEN
jgi:hypothetical protein